MIRLIAIIALVLNTLPASAKQHQDTLSEADDSAPGLESFGYAEERLPTYGGPQQRLLTGETVGYDKNKTKVTSDTIASDMKKSKKKAKKSKKGNTKIAVGKGPVKWVDLLEKDRIRDKEKELSAALAAEEEKQNTLDALGVKPEEAKDEEPKDKLAGKTGKGDGTDEGDKKNADTANAELQKKDGDLAGLSTVNGTPGNQSGGEAPAPKGAALKYTNINKLDNGTTVTVAGDNLTVDGRTARAQQVPIEGDVLRQFQQSKFFREGVAVTTQQAFGIRDPSQANIVAYQFEQNQGLTSFFGITPDRFSYYYPTNRQMQREMLAGADAQMSLVFYERRADGTLMPISGGPGGKGGGEGGGEGDEASEPPQ